MLQYFHTNDDILSHLIFYEIKFALPSGIFKKDEEDLDLDYRKKYPNVAELPMVVLILINHILVCAAKGGTPGFRVTHDGFTRKI